MGGKLREKYRNNKKGEQCLFCKDRNKTTHDHESWVVHVESAMLNLGWAMTFMGSANNSTIPSALFEEENSC